MTSKSSSFSPWFLATPSHPLTEWDFSWSKTQLAARSQPRSMTVQRALLKLFHHPPSAPVSLLTPITYADRLRIRHPGDAKFALGPHMDGGSVERWEDTMYRNVYERILKGKWDEFDAFEIGALS